MSSQLVHPRLIIQNENSNIIPKKAITEERKKKKLGLGRKALNDITNKPKIHQEASTKKKKSSEGFNIAEEGFLHDHNKCIEAQQAMTESRFWDILLPDHGPLPSEASLSNSPSKIEHYTPSCYPEPVELPMLEFSDWLEIGGPPSPESSPPSPCSPRAWELEMVEFSLKPESDDEEVIL